MDCISEFKELFIRLSKLPDTPKENKTFMEVSGYPHYETVCSNILAFFFDTSEQHGLKDLFLKSLLKAAGKESYLAGISETIVTTEYQTDRGGYVDILIETDSYNVIIENKIRAPLYNDLEDYRNSILKKNYKEIIAIVLSLGKIQNSSIINERGFINVEYDLFFAKIKEYIGDYLESINSEWFIFLKNFIKTIENEGSKQEMDDEMKELIEFFSNGENIRAIDKLKDKQSRLVDFFKSEVEKIRAILEKKIERYTFKSYASNAERRASIYHILSIGELVKAKLEVIRCVRGWEIALALEKLGKNKENAESYLRRKEIGVVEDITNSAAKSYFIPLWTANNQDMAPGEVAEEAVKLLGLLIEEQI